MGKSKDKVKPTAQEIALADISKKQFARYEKVFAPFEDEWLEKSRVSAGEKERLAGHIAGDVKQTVAGEQDRMTGMNPASGNFSAGIRELAVRDGKATARAQVEGNMQAENADVTALMSGVRLGRGQAVEAQAGMGQMATQATSRGISEAFADRASRDATGNLVGSAAGAAAYGISNFNPSVPTTGTASPGYPAGYATTGNLSSSYSLSGAPKPKAAPQYSLNIG